MNEVETLLKSVIGRIATGPDLSKDIEFDEAKAAMGAVLSGQVDPVQTAVFLIALRMKRETMDENKGILAAILAQADRQIVVVDTLVDIGDPYNGYSRSLPVSSFLPPLLAELGLPCVIHGLDSITPKFGLSHRRIYQSLGVEVDLSSAEVKKRIENKSIGWGYIDQSKYCPSLYNLVGLRNKIVKRTVINTVETLIAPVRGKTTHAVLGFVHKPYPPIYAELAAMSGFDSSLLVRGIEGGVVPSLRQQGLALAYDKKSERERIDIDPKTLGITQTVRAIAIDNKLSDSNNGGELAQRVVELGLEALAGKAGVFYDSLVYAASLILSQTKRNISLVEAAEIAREVLNSGVVKNRL